MKHKKIMIALAIVVVVAVAVLGIFHRAVYLVFHNVTVSSISIPENDTWNGGETFLNVQYSDISDTDYLNLYVPKDVEKPQLYVIIHGGGFIAGDADTKQTRLMYRYFRDKGYACASVNYRLAQEAPFPAAVEDCKAAIRFLRANADTYGYDAEKIIVFGESAGGYLATMCAVTTEDEFISVPFVGQTDSNNPSSKVDILVNYYGHTDLTGLDEDLKTIGLPKIVYSMANNWMIGKLDGFEDFTSYWLRQNISEMTESELNVADPYYYIERNAAYISDLSVWMIHGDCDITVPHPVSERLYESFVDVLGEDAVRFRSEPNMGHASDPLYSDEILEEIDSFIQSHLK